MLLSASAPVRWPDRGRIDAAWAEGLAVLDQARVDHAGELTGLDLGDEHILLTRGTHLSPGASYVMESPGLGGVGIQFHLAGSLTRRTMQANLTRKRRLGPGSVQLVTAVIDGLDHLEGIRVTSSHPYVKGTLSIKPEPRDPVRLRLRLRWLSVTVELSATDVAAPDTGGRIPVDGEDALPQRLRFHCRLTPRGIWLPVTAPLLTILGVIARQSIDDVVTDWAEVLTALAEGRESPTDLRRRTQDEALANILWAKEQIRSRIERVNHQLADAGWWGSRSRGWLRAYRQLPSITWPAREEFYPTYADECDRIAQDVARAGRKRRQAALDNLLESFAQVQITAATLVAEQRTQAEQNPVSPIRAEDLELAWLRSPRTTWAYLRSHDVVQQDPPDDDDDDDDDGKME